MCGRWRTDSVTMPWIGEPFRKEGAMPQLADEPLYEVVDGRRVELTPMGVHEGWIASVLLWHLQTFAHPRRLGRAVMEILFDLATVGKERRPDVAFVSSQRWPYDRVPPRGDNAWKVVP